MRVHGIGGVVVRPRDKRALRAWHQRYFGRYQPSLGKAPRIVAAELPAAWLQGAPKVGPASVPPGEAAADTESIVVNYVVENLDAFLVVLRQDQVEVSPNVRCDDCGKFAWCLDPEGNRIELWEPRR